MYSVCSSLVQRLMSQSTSGGGRRKFSIGGSRMAWKCRLLLTCYVLLSGSLLRVTGKTCPRSYGPEVTLEPSVHVTTHKKNKQDKNRFHRTNLSRVLFRSMGNQSWGSSGVEYSTSMCEDRGSILCIREKKKNQTMKTYPVVESTQVIEELVSVHQNTAPFF